MPRQQARNCYCLEDVETMFRKEPSDRAGPKQRRSLRTRAEVAWLLRHKDDGARTTAEYQHLVRELEVHQIELKLQNDELRHKHAELARSCARFRDLLDTAPVGYVTLDTSGQILEANITMARMLGLKRDKLIGRSLSRYIALKSAEEFCLHCRKVLSTGRRQSGEFYLSKADGARFPVCIRSVPVVDAASRSSRIHAALTEITERKEIERQLRELNSTLERRVAGRTQELTDTNERLSAILNAATSGILTLSPSGVIESINPAGVEIFGCARDEIIGQNVNRFMGAPDQPGQNDLLSHGLQTHDSAVAGWHGEVLGRRKDSGVRMLECSLAEFSASGCLRYVAIIRDITARKRLEAALSAAAEEERGRIARDLHDGVGQQLAAALFLSELHSRDLQERDASEAKRASEVHALVAKALSQVREVSRGLYPVSPDPDGLMNALRSLAERTARDRQIECEFDADSAVLLSDEALATHLYRIAQEAVNNALQHSGAGRIEIKLASTAGKLALSVRDYGKGLPQNADSGGVGLQTMSDRARLIGAQLSVQDAEDGGVRVVCSMNWQRTGV